MTELHGFRFIQSVSQSALLELNRTLVCVRVDEPKTVIRRGEQIAGAYLVLEDALRVYNIDAKGREATLYSVEAHDACIFALNCAFNGLRYPAWVANDQTPTRVATIPSNVYRRLHATDTAIQKFTFDVPSGRIFDLMSTIEELSSLDIEQRLASLLTRKCNEQGLVLGSHAKIAAHLGTAREVVSRHLSRFEAQGLLKTSRGTIGLS